MKRISSLLSRNSSSSSNHKPREDINDEAIVINKAKTIRIIGPRGSGKTTFLYKSYFKYATAEENTVFDVMPTPAHNVEVIPYKHQLYEVWDFAELSHSLTYFQQETNVVIYMMDGQQYLNNEAVNKKSREHIIWLLTSFEKQLKDTVIITAVNKIDGDMLQEIGNSWVNDKPLINLLKGHHWRIFSGEQKDVVFDYIHNKLYQKQFPNQITPWDNVPNPQHLTDQEFQQWFIAARPFLYFDLPCLLRIIYLFLLHKFGTPQLFHLLQLQLSSEQHYMNEKSIFYSETQILFWIQMVSFQLLKAPVLQGEENIAFEQKLSIDEECWKDYYSPKVFLSEKGQKEFLPPDKKSLPNAFKSSSLALRGSQLNINYQVL